ncbi:MAG: FAD-dependent oxidoreductase [Nitrospinae bacterium]|nr:FAD-dependent oxidoreductase [Nitrospinota bacterium]
MKLLFSSWFGDIVDNRGKEPSDYADVRGIKQFPADFGGGRTATAYMGWGGIVLLSEPYDIVELTYEYARALQASSCAKCFPCRTGTKVIEDILLGILEGRGTAEDLSHLARLCDSVSSNSKCGIGQLGPVALEHALKYFAGDFAKYISGERKRSGFQYPWKMTAPCTSACPTGMDIPLYIEYIKDGNPAGSLSTIREASPMACSLGRACFHPCENNCRRANVDQPLAICKLKRFAWDYEDLRDAEKPANPNKHKRPEKVAMIGAGIASLAAAYYLANKGYRVTIFEKLARSGGAIRTGIPHYRVPNEALDREIAYIVSLGVEIKYGVHFGKDETFKSLRDKGYKVIFLGTGGDLSKKMGADGEDAGYDGFYNGIDILKQVKIGTDPVPKRKRVLVVGGGNTAMDCARTFRRLGSEVIIVYRRTEKELPADPHEVYESKEEGVQYMFLEAPTKIIAQNGKISGLECQTMELGEPDASGRRRPVAVKGSEHVIPADCIISAIGQDCDIFYLKEDPNIKITKWDNPVVHPDTLQSDVADVFAGGDCVTGPLTLVMATGQGRRAAQSILQFLEGKTVAISDEQRVENLIAAIGAYDKKEKVSMPGGWKRQDMPIISHDLKVNSFEEVELGYSQTQAMEEAARCMRCYIVGMASVTSKESGEGK